MYIYIQIYFIAFLCQEYQTIFNKNQKKIEAFPVRKKAYKTIVCAMKRFLTIKRACCLSLSFLLIAFVLAC